MSDNTTETIQAVRCVRCGNLHAVDSATYLLVTGNIFVGQVSSDPALIKPSIYCRGETTKPSCLEIHLTQFRGGSGKEEERFRHMFELFKQEERRLSK